MGKLQFICRTTGKRVTPLYTGAPYDMGDGTVVIAWSCPCCDYAGRTPSDPQYDVTAPQVHGSIFDAAEVYT